jgi:Major tropism determinant N-terminal domain
MAVSFRPRRGTYFDWEAKNPILGEGEWGYEIGTGRYKVGDGVHHWMDLPYFTNEEAIKAYVDAEVAALAGSVSGVTEQQLTDHVNAVAPHPFFEDGADLTLLYLNSKV